MRPVRETRYVGVRGQFRSFVMRTAVHRLTSNPLLTLRDAVHVGVDQVDVCQDVGEDATLVGPEYKVGLTKGRFIRFTVEAEF